MSTYTIPYVTLSTSAGDRTIDIYSRLLADRIVYLGTAVDQGVANAIIAQLLHLENDSPDRPIALYINSPGGAIPSVLALYDAMQFVRAPIETTCVGEAVGSVALLLAGGTPGRRAILQHGRVVLHPPITEGGRAPIPDLVIEAEEIERVRRLQEQILAARTGRGAEQVRRDIERQLVLTPDAAIDYGIVDTVIGNRSAL
ncbi:ATP-dependent Clp protease proteolytic subunit ClpP [Rhodococcus sp. OK519]|uniref:ClpP family protease n=1 Tax=Rhodococcus sp. OK519 TaxID=2135729 RepID=UPI000D333197|nr:ATP-dependent Clp protease proteolytic subunit ClpP [Rhodococcus sp. OK519]